MQRLCALLMVLLGLGGCAPNGYLCFKQNCPALYTNDTERRAHALGLDRRTREPLGYRTLDPVDPTEVARVRRAALEAKIHRAWKPNTKLTKPSRVKPAVVAYKGDLEHLSKAGGVILGRVTVHTEHRESKRYFADVAARVAADHGATHVVLLDDSAEVTGTETTSSAHAQTIGCGPRDFLCLGTYATGQSETTLLTRPRAVFAAVWVPPEGLPKIPKELRPLVVGSRGLVSSSPSAGGNSSRWYPPAAIRLSVAWICSNHHRSPGSALAWSFQPRT